MEFINKNKSDNDFAGFLLLWVVFALFVGITILVTEGVSGFTIIILLFFILIPSLLFIDIFLWRTFGREIILTKDKILEVRKEGRLFARKKQIPFYQINKIYYWKNKSTIFDLSDSLAFWGISKQGTLCVEYNKQEKYYIGKNLSKEESLLLLEKILTEIDKG